MARLGRVVEKLPGVPQRGILYDTLVNTVRSQIPNRTEFIHAKVTGSSRPARSGRPSSCRTATRFQRALSCWRPDSTSACARSSASTARLSAPAIRSRSASTSSPRIGQRSRSSSLTYFAERPADRWPTSRCSRSARTMRANLFAYRDLHDPWLKQFRDAPRGHALPRCGRAFANSWATSPCRASFKSGRSISTSPKGYRQSGVVLVGDAFSSSCPAAGTGARKVLVDVERLCNVHIPRWLGDSGHGRGKNRRFL